MRKGLFILGLTFLGFAVFGQSFSLTYNGTNLSPDEEISIQCSIPDDNNALMGLLVNNNTTEMKSVKVKKVYLDVVEGSEESFCWGMCYPPNVFESPYPVSIDAGTSSDAFTGDYNPHGNYGSSKIRYVFFNENNSSDTISVIASYDFLDAVEDYTSGNTISIYPNPANTTLNVAIDGAQANTTVKIFNVLGKVVKKSSFSGAMLSIPVDDLRNGIYFVRIMDGDKVINTEKLLIKH